MQYVGIKVDCDDCTQGETEACETCNGHGYVIECIEEANVSPAAAALGVAGYYLFRAFLVVGLACAVGVGAALMAGGFFQ